MRYGSSGRYYKAKTIYQRHMRIENCYSAFGQFGGHIRRKYGLKRPGRNVDDPSFFFGVYGSQINRVFAHKGLAVVIWAGSDVLAFMRNKEWIDKLKSMD